MKIYASECAGFTSQLLKCSEVLSVRREKLFDDQQGFHGFAWPGVTNRVNAGRSGGGPLALIRYACRSRCMCEILNTSGIQPTFLVCAIRLIPPFAREMKACICATVSHRSSGGFRGLQSLVNEHNGVAGFSSICREKMLPDGTCESQRPAVKEEVCPEKRRDQRQLLSVSQPLPW
jgi:hypothetical protein